MCPMMDITTGPSLRTLSGGGHGLFLKRKSILTHGSLANWAVVDHAKLHFGGLEEPKCLCEGKLIKFKNLVIIINI